jgi:hypothetical protein
MMGGSASFDADRGGWKLNKIIRHGRALHFFVTDFPAFLISEENLKNVLGNVQPNKVMCAHDPSPYWRSSRMTPFALLNDTHPIGYMEAGLFHQIEQN